MRPKIILLGLLFTGSVVFIAFLLNKSVIKKVACGKCKETPPAMDSGGGNELLDGSINHLIVYTRN
jgi:hypothetical protein